MEIGGRGHCCHDGFLPKRRLRRNMTVGTMPTSARTTNNGTTPIPWFGSLMCPNT